MQLHPAQQGFLQARGSHSSSLVSAFAKSDLGISSVSSASATQVNTAPPTFIETLNELPTERGAAATSLFNEYRAKPLLSNQYQQSELSYDSPSQSRVAISEYLINQHAQRRDEIRAMVGVDLYA